MIPFDRSIRSYSVDTYINPNRVSFGQRACTDVNTLSCSGKVIGDFVHPNYHSYTKVNSRGLRGRAVYLDAAIAQSHDILVSVVGPCSSLFDSPSYLWGGANWTAAINAATSALSTKVRGDLDLSIDLFQWKQILKTTNRVFNLTQSLRKSWRNMKSGKGPLKEAADLYLEWTYGIEPTLKELVELTKKLQDAGSQGKALIHFRGRGNSKDRATISSRIDVWPRSTSASLLQKYEVASSCRCQLDIYLKPEITQWNKLSEYASLNPITWLYEATPYSFVLDWFWNFGEYMRSMETYALNAARFAYGSQTLSVRQLTTAIGGIQYVNRFSWEPESGYHDFRSMERTVLSKYPVPHLPTLGTSLGGRRMLNAAALLAQFLPDMFSNKRGRIRSGRTLPIPR